MLPEVAKANPYHISTLNHLLTGKNGCKKGMEMPHCWKFFFQSNECA